jgi:outer membrane protein assembly factor BamB
MKNAIFLLALVAMAWPGVSVQAEEGKPAQDWPQLAGPNRDCVVPGGPKLLDAWSTNGLKLVWQTEGLPYAPVCGVSSPIVAGNKVFIYANTVEPLQGITPFKTFLKKLGYAADISKELNKKIDDAQFGEKRRACKTDADVEALTKEFLGTLDPAQAKQFGDAITARMKVGPSSFGSDTLPMFAKEQDKEIDSREAFMNLFVEWFHHTIYHGGQIGMLTAFADKVYTNQVYVDMIICLDRPSGRELWRKSVPGTKKNYGVEFGCSGTPLVNKDRLYLRGSGGLVCLDIARKGEVVWQVKGGGGNNSPVLANGAIYCIVDNLKAFDAATGKQLWSQPNVIGESETPAVWTHNGTNYVLCQCDAPRYYAPFLCLNGETGKEQWVMPSGTPYNGPMSALLVTGDTLITRAGGGCAAFALSPEKFEKLWATKDCGDQGGTPIVYQGHVYLLGHSYGNDVITVLDFKTGAVTLNVKSEQAGRCSTSLIADGKIFFNGYGDYRISHPFAAKATPDKYEELGCLQTVNVGACSSPAVAGGNLYVRLLRGVACYDLRAK